MRISTAAKLCMKVRRRFDNYVGVRLQSTCNFIVKLVAVVLQNSGLVFCSIFRREKHKHTHFIVLVSGRRSDGDAVRKKDMVVRSLSLLNCCRPLGLVAASPERVASGGWTSERRTRAGPARGERRVSEGGASQRRAKDGRALGERGTNERGASEERARGLAGTGLGFLIAAPDD